MKIQAIMARKKIVPNRNNFEIISKYGCTIYNIDRKNQNGNTIKAQNSNCKVYDINSKNQNYNKNVSGSEWSKYTER